MANYRWGPAKLGTRATFTPVLSEAFVEAFAGAQKNAAIAEKQLACCLGFDCKRVFSLLFLSEGVFAGMYHNPVKLKLIKQSMLLKTNCDAKLYNNKAPESNC